MEAIQTEVAQIGMILAKDISDKNGRVLVPKGTKLGEKHLKAFKVWRILKIFVEQSGSILDDIDPQEVEKAKAKFEPLFKHTNLDHPLMTRVYEILVMHEIKG